MILKMMGWAGVVLTVASYWIVVNGRPGVGIPLSMLGCLVYGFYAFRSKIWNLMVLQGVFLGCNITGIIHYLH
jgi:hypothetical protein